MSRNMGLVLTVAAAAAVNAGCATYGDFTLSTLDGQEASLSAHKGKALLVTFFAVG